MYTYARPIQYSKNFHEPLIGRAQLLFCSLDDQYVWTYVATLCSAQYFLTSLRSTDALGNYIFIKAVTLYSNPDSLRIW